MHEPSQFNHLPRGRDGERARRQQSAEWHVSHELILEYVCLESEYVLVLDSLPQHDLCRACVHDAQRAPSGVGDPQEELHDP